MKTSVNQSAKKLMKTPKASERADTKEALLQAALRLFGKQGFDATSTKQICDEAGANVAAVAYYFETKDNLLKEVLKENFQRDLSLLALILKTPETTDEFKIKLRLFCEAMLDGISQKTSFHRLVNREADVNPIVFPFFKEAIDGFRVALHTFFKDAKRKNLISKEVNEKALGLLLFGSLIGVGTDGLLARIDSDYDFSDARNRARYLDQILKVLLDGILVSGREQDKTKLTKGVL